MPGGGLPPLLAGARRESANTLCLCVRHYSLLKSTPAPVVLRARAPHPPRTHYSPSRPPVHPAHEPFPSLALSRSAAPDTKKHGAAPLLLCALDAPPRAVVVVVVVGLGLPRRVLLVHLTGSIALSVTTSTSSVLGDGGHVLRRREHLEELRGGGGGGRRRELDVEDQEEVAVLERRLEPRGPSPSTACISRRLADASGSPMINIFAPFAGAFAAIASACVHCLNTSCRRAAEGADPFLELPLLARLLARGHVVGLRPRRSRGSGSRSRRRGPSRLLLFLERVVRHRPDHAVLLGRLRLDQQCPPVEVRQLREGGREVLSGGVEGWQARGRRGARRGRWRSAYLIRSRRGPR